MSADPVTAAFRFGFGLPLAAADATPAALRAGLDGPDTAAARWPGVALDEVLDLAQREARARAALKQAPEDAALKKDQRALREAGRALQRRGQRATFARAIGGAPLRERLAWFWTDHFTVAPRSRIHLAWPATLRDEAIRPHLTAPFGQMLKAVALHPAMLQYLDQASSIGPGSKRGQARDKGLNENYARELLELHTLGVGAGYAQADVRELAKLLTGLTYTAGRGFVFDKARVEPGAETVLGKAYRGEGLDPILQVLEDLARHPDTATHLARKLAVHFVADDPDPALVQALAREWRASDGDLGRVTGALLDHPAAWAPAAQKARPPGEFLVAALRALGLSADAVYGMADASFLRLLVAPLTAMGQEWEAAPGPDGWPEAAEAWITPAGLAARIQWAMEVPGRLVTPLPDARDLARAALGPRLGDRLAWAVGAAESRREGVGLVLSSPEFNRR